MEIVFQPVGEIMTISGPWLARVLIDGNALEDEFIEQKITLDSTATWLGLVKPIYYKSLFIKKVHFGIYVVNLMTNERFLSKEKFTYLFIESIGPDPIVFYEAFHNQNPADKKTIPFNEANFEPVINRQ